MIEQQSRNMLPGNTNTKSPLPSTLLFVSQLCRRPQGDKVRFLACVEYYDQKTATLSLFHHFVPPPPHPPPLPSAITTAQPTKVLVNIDAILDTVKRPEDLQVGSWLNVIGYITPPPPPPPPPSSSSSSLPSPNDKNKKIKNNTKSPFPATTVTAVQAILIWSAGIIDLGEYENALLARQQTGS